MEISFIHMQILVHLHLVIGPTRVWRALDKHVKSKLASYISHFH